MRTDHLADEQGTEQAPIAPAPAAAADDAASSWTRIGKMLFSTEEGQG